MRSPVQNLLIGLMSLGILATTGCAYFRFGEKSYAEDQEKHKEQQEINRVKYKPGTIFYTE